MRTVQFPAPVAETARVRTTISWPDTRPIEFREFLVELSMSRDYAYTSRWDQTRKFPLIEVTGVDDGCELTIYGPRLQAEDADGGPSIESALKERIEAVELDEVADDLLGGV